jgi:uncharacterized integral membrane protein
MLSSKKDPHFMKNVVHNNASSPYKIILMGLKILILIIIIIIIEVWNSKSDFDEDR